MPLFPSPSPLPDEIRSSLAGVLSPLLSDLLSFAYAVKAAHWAVRGPGSYELHKLFDKAYQASIEQADLLAEHLRMLGADPGGSVEQTAEQTRIDPYPRGLVQGEDHCKEVFFRSQVLLKYLMDSKVAADNNGAITTFDVLVQVAKTIEHWGGFIGDHCVTEKKAAAPVAAKPEAKTAPAKK